MFIYVYLGEQDLDVINTVENFKLFRASVVMEMIISILVILEIYTGFFAYLLYVRKIFRVSIMFLLCQLLCTTLPDLSVEYPC